MVSPTSTSTTTTSANVSFLDSFIGPGATSAEKAIQFVPPVIYTVILLYHAYATHLLNSTLQYTVFFIIVFDLTGGVLTNATTACKRWYFRPGQTAANHLTFACIHVIHILIISLVFRSSDFSFFFTASALLVIASFAIVFSPLYLKNVMAMFMVLNAIFLDIYFWIPTPGLEWFIPLLFIKICAGHLVPLIQDNANRGESSPLI